MLASKKEHLLAGYITINITVTLHKQGRSQDFSKGGGGSHCVEHYRHGVLPRNIIGCFLKKGLQRGGHRHPRTPPRYTLDKTHRCTSFSSSLITIAFYFSDKTFLTMHCQKYS